VTVQVVAVPVHAPPQPVKVEPVFGVAVRVTVVPVENTPLHSVVHLSIAEDGLLETWPPPVTSTWTSGGSFQAVGGV
jgi:hypothetical protein